jgi:hypothetical protein
VKRRDSRIERESETRRLRADSMAERWRDGSRAPAGSKMVYAISGSGGRRVTDASKGEARDIWGGSWANESEPVLSTVSVPFVVIAFWHSVHPPRSCAMDRPTTDRGLPTFRHGSQSFIRLTLPLTRPQNRHAGRLQASVGFQQTHRFSSSPRPVSGQHTDESARLGSWAYPLYCRHPGTPIRPQ